MSRLILLTRTDGVQLGFTDNSSDITYSGFTYYAMDTGEVSAVSQTAGSGVDNSEATGLLVSSRLTEHDLLAGLYDGATYRVMLIHRDDPSAGVVVLNAGVLGEVGFGNNAFRAEVRGLMQFFKQEVGDATSRDCRCRSLGDAQCKVALAGYSFNRTVSATGVNATGAAAAAVVQINAGGGSVSSWAADTDYSGGTTGSTTSTITTSGVVNPAPASVYQTWRYVDAPGSFTYTIPGLVAAATYHVRLHFAETFHTGPNLRNFDIFANTEAVAYSYDIWVQAGGKNLAVVLEFDADADASGNLALLFNHPQNDSARVQGLEVYTKPQSSIVGGINFGTDSAASGYYDSGLVKFLTGSNAGKSFEFQTHLKVSGNAVVSLRTQPPFTVLPGDTATLIAGCRFTFSCCVNKFSNGINFHGEPHLPGNNAIIRIGRQSS